MNHKMSTNLLHIAPEPFVHIPPVLPFYLSNIMINLYAVVLFSISLHNISSLVADISSQNQTYPITTKSLLLSVASSS